MRVTAPTKILILAIGVLVVLYITFSMLISIYAASPKFEVNKYKNINYFLYENASREYLFPYDLLPETDYNTLIDSSFNFTKISFPCAAPLLLVVVHSSPTNAAKRKVIRETWGQNQEDVKVLFFLGSVTSEEMRQNLSTESNLHHDIIQGSFLDSYRNLTYKHVMVLKYVVYHCRQVKYILKTDDDIFVNMPLIKTFLTKDLSPFGAEKLLMCSVVYKAKAFRTFRSKWRVSFEEYPHRQYPTYCLGWAILYSPDVVFSFYREAQRTDYFWIDDVYITGIIADKINFVGHTDISPLTLSSKEVTSLTDVPRDFRPFLFGSGEMKEKEIRSLWKYAVNSPVANSIENEVANER